MMFWGEPRLGWMDGCLARRLMGWDGKRAHLFMSLVPPSWDWRCRATHHPALDMKRSCPASHG